MLTDKTRPMRRCFILNIDSPKTAPAGVRARNKIMNIISIVETVIKSFMPSLTLIIERFVLTLKECKIWDNARVKKARVIPPIAYAIRVIMVMKTEYSAI